MSFKHLREKVNSEITRNADQKALGDFASQTASKYQEALEVGRALLAYIDAIPKGITFACAMPGVDREWVERVLGPPTRSYNVKLQRVEYYYENIIVHASSAEEAERIANEKLESGEISFDGEVCDGDEQVVEVTEAQGST